MTELLLEEVHGQDTTDITGIIAKQNATESGEGAHEIGSHRDGRLDSGGRDAIPSGGRVSTHDER